MPSNLSYQAWSMTRPVRLPSFIYPCELKEFFMKLSKLSVAVLSTFSVITPSFAVADSTKLDLIVVSANNTPQPLSSVTANMTIITAEEITEKQYKTLDEALRQVPGFSTYRSGGLGTATSVRLRGEDGGQILVLQDGVELNNPISDGADFSALYLNNVERIEIVKGAQSGIWGDGAMAGVINIITKKPQKIATANIETGSFGYKKLHALLGDGNEQFDFSVQLTDVATDGHTAIKKISTSNDGYENDSFSQQSVAFKMGLNLANHQRLETTIQNINSSVEYDAAAYNDTYYGTGYNQADPNALYSSDYNNQLKQIRYLAKFDNIESQLSLQNNKTTTNYSVGELSKLQLGLSSSFIDNQIISLAFDKKWLEGISSPGTSYEKKLGYDQFGIGLTASQSFLQNRVLFNAAFRQDSYDDYSTKSTGKIGVKTHLSSNFSIQTNYGTAFKAPSLYEEVYSSNSINLMPETKESFDIGFDLFDFNLTYFKTKYDREIEYDRNLFSFTNLNGHSNYEGFEASYPLQLHAIDSQLTAQYTLQTAKDSQNLWLARRPDSTASLVFDNYSLDNWHFGFVTHYIGNSYDLQNEQGAKIGDAILVDITTNYQANKYVNLYLKVQNITNQDAISSVAGYTDATSQTIAHVYDNGGTQIFAGLKGQFK